MSFLDKLQNAQARADAQRLPASSDRPPVVSPPTVSMPSPKPRRSTKRTNQVIVRLSDAERTKLDSLIQTSGRPQGEYIRETILTGLSERASVDSVAPLLMELSATRADLLRISDLLKPMLQTDTLLTEAGIALFVHVLRVLEATAVQLQNELNQYSKEGL